MWIYQLSKIKTLKLDTYIQGMLQADWNSTACGLFAYSYLPTWGSLYSAQNLLLPHPEDLLPLTVQSTDPNRLTPHPSRLQLLLPLPLSGQAIIRFPLPRLSASSQTIFSLINSRPFSQPHSPGPQTYLKLNWTFPPFLASLISY